MKTETPAPKPVVRISDQGHRLRKWIGQRRLLGMLLLFLGSVAIYLIVSERIVATGLNAVEVALKDASHGEATARVVIKQHYRGPVLLMNWILENKGPQQWQRVTGKAFPGGLLLDRDREFSFNITRPIEAASCRVRVQYGVGLYGVQLWRERARLAWRSGRLAAALRWNEWEARESVADLAQ